MSTVHISRRVVKVAYVVTRVLVYVMALIAALAILGFVILRINGVPGPILREVLRRAHASGIPVGVERITLTLRGWRADGVRYYSAHPDDLDPIFLAEQIFFVVRNHRENSRTRDLHLDVKAISIDLAPSVTWGVPIPIESPIRHVDMAEASIAVSSNQVVISHGRIEWLGIRANLNGTVSNSLGFRHAEFRSRLFPDTVKEEQIVALQEKLKMLSLANGADVDLNFFIDVSNCTSSRVDLAVQTDGAGWGGVGFSGVKIAGSYAHPWLRLQEASLFDGQQSVQLSGGYNMDSKEAQVSLVNSITSPRFLELLPDAIGGRLNEYALQIGELPRLEIEFGPAVFRELPGQMNGRFSVQELAYKDVEIETLRGRIESREKRVELSDLYGVVEGRQESVAEMESAMRGGPAEGMVFWDGDAREFGIEADLEFDPNLLVQALAPVEIATNIIRRFTFKDQPPKAHVTLGSNVDDWETFYINIRAMANDVAFQQVLFSSINIVQTYRNGRLSLDPVAATQGMDFLKGFAWIDLDQSTVEFDALSSMNPEDLEDIIYPDLNLFGHQIKAAGDVRLEARGLFDWGTMSRTAFSAKVEAEQVEIPVAPLDRFTANVTGNGPLISVEEASFGLYDGEGQGNFHLTWNPLIEALPWEADLSFSKADFRQCLNYLRSDRSATASGKMQGRAEITADFSSTFFRSANGTGFVEVEEGQLTDLPLFQGFSRLMRKVIPSFTVFSITSLRGNFSIRNGVISSDDAYFGGDVLSAKGWGSYSETDGFDASIQAQVLNEGQLFNKMVQAITNPLMRLLKMRLRGPLSEPSWHMENF